MSEIVSADYVQVPLKRPGLFPGRPWTVYFERGLRSDGKRVKRGMSSFRLKREAIEFMKRICPTINPKDLPF